MAADKLTLINAACRELGEPRISDISLIDETKVGRELNAVYDEARLEALRDYYWSFSRTRAELTRSDATGAILQEWLYSYAKPSGWVRTIGMSPTGDFTDNLTSDYADEGGVILSNNTTLYMLYVTNVTDETKFDALFDVAFPMLMASKVVTTVAQSGTLQDRLRDMLSDKRLQSQAISAGDGGLKPRRTGRWRSARHG